MESKIKSARISASLTQKEACDTLGIPIRTFQNWEQGKREAPDWLERLIIEKIHTLKK